MSVFQIPETALIFAVRQNFVLSESFHGCSHGLI